MDYPYENLDPERFQQFCQALLVREHPHIQCFPVGQPDGGRDATSFLAAEKNPDFIVFQVKFVRNPRAESDTHNWLTNTIKAELPKVQKLIPKGAKQYLLLTNVAGTAHPGSGSIDRLNQLLTEVLGIPCRCLWRDDLNRRLDGAWDLKWVYTELMTGPDLIRSVVEQGPVQERERRMSTIKSFVRDQYQIDQQVRFKQVELQNRLLDLFIDVPIEMHHSNSVKIVRQFNRIASEIWTAEGSQANRGEEHGPDLDLAAPWYFLGGESQAYIGGASFLLHPWTHQFLPQIVLEGAPGQGKSTIVQYVCQVHRMRLLGEEDLASVPRAHQLSPLRIPFKVDLRDFAAWLAKKDPFTPEDSGTPPAQWYKSLEAFLLALVRHHSGGADFVHDDLLALCRGSAILLVFDGLDEIADITWRSEVVDEIIKGVNRLGESCGSLQVVVTSRPAAFANSPGLPEDAYPYFQLGSVSKALVNDYANKWLSARQVDPRQSLEFKKILQNKLDQPHLRDLARNPMQLAILLSLILTRGASLPDKRTALYDAYIELFFNREAEKSPIVRDYRDLLVDIHRYLAWVIHSEAELGHGRGSVGSERLRSLVRSYLEREGYDVALADRLFTGMVERVVALVSRVEGTYEFEVQPLREYFAARFLYDTAPYSPPGQEQHGTLPDRFDAIARDFHWLNVTRFYAGCYNKGELASLVDRLQDLSKAEGYRLTNYPRMLASTLLADWVFAQHPKSVRDVAGLVLEESGLRALLSSTGGRRGPIGQFVLPENCGKREVLRRCFDILLDDPPRDYASEIVRLAKANGNPEELKRLWLEEISRKTPQRRTRWIDHGRKLGTLSRLTTKELEDLFSDGGDELARLRIILLAGRADFIEANERRTQTIIRAILQNSCELTGPDPRSVLDHFCHSLDPVRYRWSFQSRQPVALQEMWRAGYIPIPPLDLDRFKGVPRSEALAQCIDVIRVAVSEGRRTASEWASDLSPWNNIVEKARSIYGENWSCFQLAIVASGIKSSTRPSKQFAEMLDHSMALCPRARYARLRAGGASSWWERQFRSIKGELDRMFVSGHFLAWASSSTGLAALDYLQSTIEVLAEANWRRLARALELLFLFPGLPEGRFWSFDVAALPGELPPRTATAIALRVRRKERHLVYSKYLSDYEGNDPVVLRFCATEAMDWRNIGRNWRPNLGLVRKAYSHRITPGSLFRFRGVRRLPRPDAMPLRLAAQILEHAQDFPTALVAVAETRCRQAVARKIIPVGRIAEQEGWFSR